MAEWEDLSDSELRDRLIRRKPGYAYDPERVVDTLVKNRDDEEFAEVISLILDSYG